jgi:hypothetical protein
MEPTLMTQSPFGAVTFIAAPALLTNASSVLALSTINRMLATRDQMQRFYNKSAEGKLPEAEAGHLVEKVNRVEKQAELLLGALHSIYTALAAFASATLVTLLGVGSTPFHYIPLILLLMGIGLILGFIGVGGLVMGCGKLFKATQISLVNIREEATQIRQRQSSRV